MAAAVGHLSLIHMIGRLRPLESRELLRAHVVRHHPNLTHKVPMLAVDLKVEDLLATPSLPLHPRDARLPLQAPEPLPHP